jgi:hypothetical protein
MSNVRGVAPCPHFQCFFERGCIYRLWAYRRTAPDNRPVVSNAPPRGPGQGPPPLGVIPIVVHSPR